MNKECKRLVVVDSTFFGQRACEYLNRRGFGCNYVDDMWGLPLPDDYDDFMKRREADGYIVHVIAEPSFLLAKHIKESKIPLVVLVRSPDGAFSCYDLEIRGRLEQLDVPMVVKFGSVDEVVGEAIGILERVI
jgi:hypothetical protein